MYGAMKDRRLACQPQKWQLTLQRFMTTHIKVRIRAPPRSNEGWYVLRPEVNV